MTNTLSNKAEFKREERYIVIKRKHLHPMTEASLRNTLNELGVGTVECVVVESDWPEYEAVWRMIEERVTGRSLSNKVVDTQELLPCPFCGGEAQFQEEHRNHWRVVCMKCGIRHSHLVAGEVDPRPRLIRAWNTRTTQCSGDKLADHFPTGLRSTRHRIAGTNEVIESPIQCDCHCGASFAGTDEQEVRQLWAEHVSALPSDKTVELLREARAWVSSAEHDEDCELHPEYGEQNLEASNSEAEEAALEAGGDECDVRYRTYPDDAVCTCERGRFLAKLDSHLGEMK